MRFIEDGPSIPDELLIARDEGNVVFFCGAGVSQNDAELPDFFSLVGNVCRSLGITEHDAIQKQIEIGSKDSDKITIKCSGDRAFGLLEKDFFLDDIEHEVAKALKPKKLETHPEECYRSHKILLDLATTPNNDLQLVTTNFDRLFEDALGKKDSGKYCHLPPRLPSIRHGQALNGITYLHGRVNKEYDSSDKEGQGFILTSAQYGRAYLAHGWATDFFKDILVNFTVVFVGYSADDPPIQYLLEALNQTNRRNKIYAFAQGSEASVISDWASKGAKGIIFQEYDQLWDSLSEWAARARNPQKWIQKIAVLAKKGPQNLQPYERGQVAHLVSSTDGAKAFAQTSPTAEWLYVFDKNIRLKILDLSPSSELEATAFQNWYKLDSDNIEAKISSYDFTPPKVNLNWDAFEIFATDSFFNEEKYENIFYGENSKQTKKLPERLDYLCRWLASVSNQYEALTWVARKKELHPNIITSLRFKLLQPDSFNEPYKQAWTLLLSHVDLIADEAPLLRQSALAQEASAIGWNLLTLTKLASEISPILVCKPYSDESLFSPKREDDLIKHLGITISFPPTYLPTPENHNLLNFLDIFIRKLLSVKKLYEVINQQLPRVPRLDFSPLSHAKLNYNRQSLTNHLKCCAQLFSLAYSYKPKETLVHLISWPTDDPIFFQLKVWCFLYLPKKYPKQALDFILSAHQHFLEEPSYYSDLTKVASHYWKDFSPAELYIIENVLSKEVSKRDLEEEPGARVLASRVYHFVQLIDGEQHRLSDVFHDKMEHIGQKIQAKERPALNPIETRVGFIRQEESCDALQDLALEKVIKKAKKISKIDFYQFEETDPWSGYCKSETDNAINALILELENTENGQPFDEWPWKKFFSSTARENFPQTNYARSLKLIKKLQPNHKILFVEEITDWLEAQVLNSNLTETNIVEVISDILTDLYEFATLYPHDITSQTAVDWFHDSCNFFTGKLAKLLVNAANEHDTNWQNVATLLINYPMPLARYGIAYFSAALNSLLTTQKSWVEKHLYKLIENPEKKEAFCVGALVAHNQSSIAKAPDIMQDVLLQALNSAALLEGQTLEMTCSLLLNVWAAEKGNKETKITDSFVRQCLVINNKQFRHLTIQQIEMWLRSDSEQNTLSIPCIVDFFKSVWPKHKHCRSNKITCNLIEVLLWSGEFFPELYPAISPVLTKMTDATDLPAYLAGSSRALCSHAIQFFELFEKILPEDESKWPYEMSHFFIELERHAPSLTDKPRFQILRAKCIS
ncbi:SIR2 family protein [Pelagibaculum spongiae]|uniref:Uncharacterized protein n=1 Tax=Pelagibaculum spongiae TaxID=2080658 RepID=A0A2V1GXU9_9GAMM|nr:SIR2 family protein [Pelagibaculum spongiae]PVZ64997.1 hypothetical protein DC094_19245 [Pelagibaculum spongiae]